MMITLRRKRSGFAELFVYSFLLSGIRICTALDTISPGQSIRDGDTMISAGESFELGFFSPGGSTNRYLAIWYKKVSSGTVVWVANRETPVLDRSGVLNITDQGILVLLNSTNDVIWSSYATRTAKSPVAKLLDSGNFVVTDRSDSSNNAEDYLWQSFDYPTDTFLAGMKLGKNFVTGLDTSISSWKSFDDPARGEYTFGIDPSGFPQLVVEKGSVIEYRLGPWNGIGFSGAPGLRPNPIYAYGFVLNDKEAYYKFELLNCSLPSRFVVNASGLANRLIWIDKTNSWAVYYAVGADQCYSYAVCGPNARCNNNNYPVCACLEGFEPKSIRDWSLQDWSGGCVRKTPLACHNNGEGFVKYEGLKLPDTSNSWYNMSMNLDECKRKCLKNCTCNAYTNSDISGRGSGCLLWFHDLIDMRDYSDTGQEIFIRMSASYLDSIRKQRRNSKKRRTGIIVCSVILGKTVFILGWILYIRKRKLKNREKKKRTLERFYSSQIGKEELELPLIDLATMLKATENFSSENTLGQGGFGTVYKGILSDGKAIAVKRLSMNSGQGLEEFINEVILIAKLQHRNLVNLCGFCIDGDERILIYEYMPNKSLNYFIFDQSKCRILDWHKRINIIDGIARGLLYLHQDSRLRIVHRDLKISNILLDTDMNPKISDFGIARIFEGNQTEANTNRVMGTYGYMAPEYAIDGLFSLKSDIFSFGVIVLEILSGKKNRGFYCPEHNHNLLGHAWKLWMEQRPLELMDHRLEESHFSSEIVRRIHVALLCVQQRPDYRPDMSTVALMLGGESSLPQPKQPGFFIERDQPEGESSSSNIKFTSTNEITLSVLNPR